MCAFMFQTLRVPKCICANQVNSMTIISGIWTPIAVSIYHLFMLQYSPIRVLSYTTSSKAKVIKINLASWHAPFAKAYTAQLLRASIITKCNKIRQTDYISKLRSKIKHNLGEQLESRAHWAPDIMWCSSGWANYM